MGDAALIKKLGLKPGHHAAVVNPPAGYLERIGPPEGVEAATRLDGSFDFIQVFALDRAALDRDIGAAHGALAPGGLLWVSYPKGSSKVPTARRVPRPRVAAATWKTSVRLVIGRSGNPVPRLTTSSWPRSSSGGRFRRGCCPFAARQGNLERRRPGGGDPPGR